MGNVTEGVSGGLSNAWQRVSTSSPDPFVQRGNEGEVVAIVFSIKKWDKSVEAAVLEAGFKLVRMMGRYIYFTSDRPEETSTSACKRLLAVGVCDQPSEFCRLKAVPTTWEEWRKHVFPYSNASPIFGL